MYGFVIAIMLCKGDNCDLIRADPDVYYQSYEQCDTARSASAAALQAMADKRAAPDRTPRIICMHPIETIVEVEEPHDVLETAIVHKEPSASSQYIGLVEKGKRTLVTGLVAGTGWVRVILPDGKSGFVFADRLRRIGGGGRAESVTAGTLPPNAVAPASPVAAPEPAPTPPQVVSSSSPASPVKPVPAVPAAPAPTPPSQQAQAVPRTSPSPEPPAQVALAVPPPPPPAAASPSATTNAKEFRDCETCPVMVMLPAGGFEMGSNEDPSERPPHHVTLHAFAISKFEVSLAEWDACVAAHGCSYKPSEQASPDRRAIDNVSWTDANQYVQWLAKLTGKPYRLPSEAEWEYAASAGTTTRYGWGDQAGVAKADCKGCGGPYDDRRPDDIGTVPAERLGSLRLAWRGCRVGR